MCQRAQRIHDVNKQEIFDAVAIGIRAQGGPAIQGNNCSYRSPNGRKCAAGLLIKDEDYDPAFEGHAVTSLPDRALPGFVQDDTYFLHQLQMAHDRSAFTNGDANGGASSDADFFAKWHQEMIKIAESNEVMQTALLIDVTAAETVKIL
jgi:hypothetical protein